MKSSALFWLKKLAGSLFAGTVLWRMTQEFYILGPTAGEWLGKFSLKWALAFVIFAIFCLLLLALSLVAIWKPAQLRQVELKMAAFLAAKWPSNLGWLRWLLATALALLPVWLLLHTAWGDIFSGAYLRLLLMLFCSLLVAVLITLPNSEWLATPANLAFAIVFVGALFFVFARLSTVTAYPFSLSWSEGNRLYDFSLQVDPGRYNYPGQLSIPYDSPGRYLLWGIVFAIPNTPIWLHRLWDALLYILPYLLFSFHLSRWSQLKQSSIHLARWTFLLWVYLFLAQGPVYPHLMVSALLLVAFVQPYRVQPLSRTNLVLSLLGVALTSYYATSSRWTWLPAGAAWAVIILLSEFHFEKHTAWWRQVLRLVPIGLVGALGLVAGALTNNKLFVFSPQVLSSTSKLSQPLLWYRLFPNVTYSDGILLGLTLAIVPVSILLLWTAISKRWRVNWLQDLTYLAACLAFLAIGTVASVKIGGGSNLHNMDMLFITLALLAALALRSMGSVPAQESVTPELIPAKWPAWLQVVLAFALVLPAWSALKGEKPLHLPTRQATQETLDLITLRAEKALRRGEVLFIDQRQLLTFDYVKNIPLVPEYEKKFMMDNAMSGKADYFADLYRDLANKRFSLIISEPFYLNTKGDQFSFGEENNVWVKWVAAPIMCYYAPIATLPEFGVQLLVPRNDPVNCP
ncbi:MAG: hypothetical protein AB1894_22080 [Chloroflexota bacterium]